MYSLPPPFPSDDVVSRRGFIMKRHDVSVDGVIKAVPFYRGVHRVFITEALVGPILVKSKQQKLPKISPQHILMYGAITAFASPRHWKHLRYC